METSAVLDRDSGCDYGSDGRQEAGVIEVFGQTSAQRNWILDVEDQLSQRNDYILNEDTRRVPTGLSVIDAAIDGGIRPGEVFGLMARSGTGKTVAMCNMMRHWGERCRDRTQVCFSLEMPATQIALRNTQIVYGLTKQDAARAIQNGAMNDGEYRRVFSNLIIVDRPGLTIPEMTTILKGIPRMTGKKVGMFAIDYLGRIGGAKGASTYDKVSQVAIDVKELARNFDAAALLLIQVSREKGGDGTRPLSLGSARDSGVIEEAVDYMAGLWRKNLEGDDLGMALLKNRHGDEVRRLTIHFNKVDLTLTDFS